MSPLPPTRDRALTTLPPLAGAGEGYGAPEAGRRRWLRRLGVVLVVSLAVLLGAVGAVLFFAKSEINELIAPRTAAMRAAQLQLAKPLPNQPTNVLLLGSDHRKNTTDKGDQRSDTLLLVRLDPKRRTISMLSFPRDLYVPIPGHGEAKINDAYTEGGPALSVKTIKGITGLDVNMVMNVDFTGFRGVVDQLGGVWVDVDRRYLDEVSNQVSDIDIKPGYQLLDGADTLAYARFRHDNRGDFNRIARQQQVLAGLKKQVGSSSLARNVPGLFRVFRTNTEVVAGGGDSIDSRVLYDYLRLALQLDGKDVYEVDYEGEAGTGPGDASIVLYDEAKMKQAVQAFLAPDARAREQTADQLVGAASPQAGAVGEGADAAQEPVAPTTPRTPPPSAVSVKVLNGTGTTGAARSLAQQLGEAGYRVDPEQANADNPNYASTKVLYATPAARPAAEALAAGISGASIAPKHGANAFSTQLLVIVGSTGTEFSQDGADTTTGGDAGGAAVVAPHAGNAVPARGAANVVSDPQGASDQFFEVDLARLPILVPTVRERSSQYEEAYAYQFRAGSSRADRPHEAYRLVAKTQQGDYWGLQGMTWHEPSILDGATREAQRNGRRYRLYFNGTKLHMVAWRQGAGTYWVANSVLNNLSNETMLAIADGVKPLR